MTSDVSVAAGAGERVSPDVPKVGSPVTLLPVSIDGVWVGEVASWTASPGGLVVTSEVVTTDQAVHVLNMQRVWVLARTSQTDTLVVFEAIAQARGADVLSLTGVVAIAHESRRRAVRAATVCPVMVDLPSGEPLRTQTVDLSSSGCRIIVPPGRQLSAETTVDLVVELEAHGPVRASGDVLRVDDERGEAVVRFVEIAPEDGGRIERVVLRQIREQVARASSLG